MKVAIIGAGASGITAVKCCLDEGLEPTCYERTEDIGGLWRYTDVVSNGQACVMRSTIINTSKEMMCYSDFPIPAEYPIFMHNTYVQKYFNLYVDTFCLGKHIRLRHEVISVKQTDDFDTNGKWQIKVKDVETDSIQNLIFDAVMICTGHHAEKNIPDFPGLTEFKGKVLHSHDYRHTEGYEGKRVVVIGIGNSGGDAAVELSRVASQGDVILPSNDEMLKDIRDKADAMRERYNPGLRHTIQVEWIEYMDQLAELNKCLPDFRNMFIFDPKLAISCFFGPSTPYQYRLTGPGKWSGARDAIFTQWKRTKFPLETRPLGFEETPDGFSPMHILVIIVIAFILYFIFVR